MKTIDDYKMILHNSAIVINNCNWEDVTLVLLNLAGGCIM